MADSQDDLFVPSPCCSSPGSSDSDELHLDAAPVASSPAPDVNRQFSRPILVQSVQQYIISFQSNAAWVYQ